LVVLVIAFVPADYHFHGLKYMLLSPLSRTHAEGVLTFGGTFSGCGILRPSELISFY